MVLGDVGKIIRKFTVKISVARREGADLLILLLILIDVKI